MKLDDNDLLARVKREQSVVLHTFLQTKSHTVTSTATIQNNNTRKIQKA